MADAVALGLPESIDCFYRDSLFNSHAIPLGSAN